MNSILNLCFCYSFFTINATSFMIVIYLNAAFKKQKNFDFEFSLNDLEIKIYLRFYFD